jgi:hypothetical protein
MRRELVSVMFAGFVGAYATPLAVATRPTADETSGSATAPVAVQSVPAKGIRDEAAMVLVGSAMIALAAAVRRAA